MPDYRSFARRFIAAAGLAAAVAGGAALGGPAADADTLRPVNVGTIITQSISALQVQAGGTNAKISFTTAEPTIVSIDHKVAGATAAPPSQTSGRRPIDSVRAPIGGAAVATTGTVAPVAAYKTQYEIPLTNLKSNTTYDVFVVATTQSGQQFNAQTRFTTLKQRVRFTLESIDIKDDGDGFLSGDGEPLWFVKPIWDGAFYQPAANGGALCFPNTRGRCDFGSYGSGRFTPRNGRGQAMVIVYAEENFDRFPSTLSLRSWAKEDDAVGGAWLVECVTGGCPVGDDAVQHDFRVPQGVESTVQRIALRGDDASTGFESVLTFRIELFHDNTPYPWHSRNMPSHTWYDG
jgi:hypothetical protein